MSWTEEDDHRLYVDKDGDKLTFSVAPDEEGDHMLYIGTKRAEDGAGVVMRGWAGVYVPLDEVPELFAKLLQTVLELETRARGGRVV